MTPSIWQILIILAVVLLLFARPGKISGLMGDFGKGLRSFKDGVKGDEEADEPETLATPEPKKKAAKKAAKTSGKTSGKKAAKKATKKATAKKAAKKATGKKKAAKKS